MAEQANNQQEVPVGAVVVRDGQIIGRGHNRTITDHDPSGHAEIVALRETARAIGSERIGGATLYVTLEPCCMCAGAIVQARVAQVVYGAADARAGAAGSVFDTLLSPLHNHIVDVTGGVMEQPCAQLLKDFFQQRRQSRK